MIISETRSADGPHFSPALPALLWRHRFKLALPAAAGLAAAYYGYSTAIPSYRSETILVLDARRIQALSTEAVVSPLPQDSPALRSELDVIGSTSMAAEVVKRLEAEGVRFPVPQKRAGLDQSAQAAPASATAADEKIARLLRGLSVTNDGRSYTIYIDYTNPDAAFASRVADGFANAYIDHQADAQRNETRRVADWLGGKLDSLRQRLQESERAAEDFRQKAGLTQASGTTLQALRVTALQADLMDAGANLAGAQARVDTARRLQEKGDIPALAEVLASPAIQSLRRDQADAERKLSVIRSSGASKSDQIPLLDNEIEASRKQIAAEVENVVASLQSEIAVAGEKYGRISKALADAQKSLGDASLDQVKLDQLEREASANRAVYEGYLQRYKQAIEQEGIVTPEARIISSASTNTWKVAPRLVNWMALGLVGGGALGLAALLFSEILNRRHRSPRDMARLIGLPVLGTIPRLSRRELAKSATRALDARSEYGRAVSALNAVLRTGHGERTSRVLAVASPCAGDGKSSVIAGMARAFAVSGRRVVVVDADTRRPALAKAFGARPQGYLDEALSPGRAQPLPLCKDAYSSAFLLAGRKYAQAPEALLGGEPFVALIADLKKRFDVVLIDTEAFERSSAALHVALAADEVLLVLSGEPGETARAIALIESLAECRRRPLGFVVNRIRRSAAGNEADALRQRAQEVAAQYAEPGLPRPADQAVR